jgi:hypothetical protein
LLVAVDLRQRQPPGQLGIGIWIRVGVSVGIGIWIRSGIRIRNGFGIRRRLELQRQWERRSDL